MKLHPLVAAFGLALSLVVAPSHAIADDTGFLWEESPEGYSQFLWNGRPAVRYMMPEFDESSASSREATYKPFHHVFSPDGQTLLTKGPGGLYTHHRGLFYGFNKITYGDGKRCDIWHCSGKAHQRADGHNWLKGWIKGDEPENAAPGAVGDRSSHSESIQWYGQEGEAFAREYRELAVSRESHFGVEGWEIDFASRLESVDGKPIHLDGDPQHAGFQFRASQEVAEKTAHQTYYLRVDGKGEPGDYRNWDHTNPAAPGNAECENRPWLAMSFVVEGQRFTVLYIDHPDNPKPARYSERDYGRFGSYFVAEVTKDRPLEVVYRLWVQEGEMTVDQCQELQRAYPSDLEKKIRDDPFGG